MLVWTDWPVEFLLRPTLGLGISALAVGALIALQQIRSPRVQQLAWSLVLLNGLVLMTFPIELELLAPRETRVVSVAPQAVSTEAVGTQTNVDESSVASAIDGEFVNSTASTSTQQPPSLRSLLSFGGTIVWLAGTIVLAGIWLYRYLGLLRFLRTATRADHWAATEWAETLEEQGVRSRIPMLFADTLGPLVCWTPSGARLVVPADQWPTLGEWQRRAVLNHEASHLRRRDGILGLFSRLVVLIHWFNPLVWWAAARLEQCVEWACDDQACGRDAKKAKSLAYGIAAFAGCNTPPAPLVAPISRRPVAYRIARLLNQRPERESRTLLGVLVAVAMVLFLATSLEIRLVAARQQAALESEQVVNTGMMKEVQDLASRLVQGENRATDNLHDWLASAEGPQEFIRFANRRREFALSEAIEEIIEKYAEGPAAAPVESDQLTIVNRQLKKLRSLYRRYAERVDESTPEGHIVQRYYFSDAALIDAIREHRRRKNLSILQRMDFITPYLFANPVAFREHSDAAEALRTKLVAQVDVTGKPLELKRVADLLENEDFRSFVASCFARVRLDGVSQTSEGFKPSPLVSWLTGEPVVFHDLGLVQQCNYVAKEWNRVKDEIAHLRELVADLGPGCLSQDPLIQQCLDQPATLATIASEICLDYDMVDYETSLLRSRFEATGDGRLRICEEDAASLAEWMAESLQQPIPKDIATHLCLEAYAVQQARLEVGDDPVAFWIEHYIVEGPEGLSISSEYVEEFADLFEMAL